MSIPTTKAIKTKLAQRGVKHKDLDSWAAFLQGLNWNIINPLIKMAVNSKVHPALAAGLTARSTGDQTIKATLQAHLETKAGHDKGGAPSGQPNEGTPPG